MLGSIISNTLLVLGCTFLGGSCNNKLQSINAQGALALSSLLLIVAVAFSLPTIHFLKFGSGDGSPDSIDKDHVKVSRACAILLFLIYAAFLYFQMKSHKDLFESVDEEQLVNLNDDLEAQTQSSSKSSSKKTLEHRGSANAHSTTTDSDDEQINRPASLQEEKLQPQQLQPQPLQQPTPTPRTATSPTTPTSNFLKRIIHPEQNNNFSTRKTELLKEGYNTTRPRTRTATANPPEPEHISIITAVLLLTITTVIVAFAAEYMVDAIGDIATQSGISTAFIAMILIPIAGNVVEHVTSVAVSLKGKMDLAIGVALGSALQIALFVYPLLVFISWGLDNGLTFVFNGFDIAVLCATAVLVYALIGDGKTHFLEGWVLIFTYVIVAVCYYFTPSNGYEV
ncbi:unnamed protein product [Ambrosiozyma monospora]|uniref:Unnamed protein product n=1 Tax=Ambrosiozyma monospora TaxID=43982 RepID=A0A9W6YS23_AMBMO|nr:unnamed protein product [Ambrosiozyma monospora]